MASRRSTIAPSSFKNDSIEAKSSKGATTANKASNGGPGKKPVKTSGTAVKSRYLQSAEKSSLTKSNSSTDKSMIAPLRPSSLKASGIKSKVDTPPRRSLAPQALLTSMALFQTDPSSLGKRILHSTFSDGHSLGPDFDISVIKDKTVIENAADPERHHDDEKKLIDMQTFLLTYLTAKMEHKTAKLKAAAEEILMQKMDEEEILYNKVKEKKRQYLLAEKKRVVNEMLDLQIASLTPVAESAEQFTNNYKSFARALDTTRHELPVKNFFIDGDGREFLDEVEASLKKSEKLLKECTQGDHKDNSTSLDCLKDMKRTSVDIGQQLSGACSQLQELSSLTCHHAVEALLAKEEEQLGEAETRKLYCPKQ